MHRTLLLLPAFAAASVQTTATMDLAVGYRIDRYEQKSVINNAAGSATFKDLGSTTIDLSGRLSFNHDFFVRSFGSFGFMTQTPKLSIAGGSDSLGEKKYAFAVGGAVGWQFNFSCDAIALFPEFGYDYTRLKFDSARYIGVGAPFAGLGLTWDFTRKAALNFGFEYAFAGARREIFYRDGDKITSGSFQGPKGKIDLTYNLNPQWSLGAGYTFRYLFSNKRDFTLTAGSVNGLNTTWTTHRAMVNVGYTF